MTGELRLDAETAYRGGAELIDAGRELTDVRNSAGARVENASAARPWGTDAVGAAFQKNFDQAAPGFFEAWTKLAGYLEALGVEAVEAVVTTVAADEASGNRIIGI